MTSFARVFRCLLLLPLFAGIGALSAESVEPATNWALIVHVGPAGTAEAQRLARTLRESWGFDAETVIELYDEQATVDGISAAMLNLYEGLQLNDGLFVYLSLRVNEIRAVPELLAFDSDPAAPWTTINLMAFAKWMNLLPTGNAFMAFPACPNALVAPTKKGDYAQHNELFATLEYGERPGPIEVLQVCDAIWGAAPRRATAMDDDLPPDGSRRGQLAEQIGAALDRVAAAGNNLSAEDLRDMLNAADNGFSARLVRIPEYERRGWWFVYTPPDFSQYHGPYVKASGTKQRQTVLTRMAASGLKTADGLEPRVAFLRGVALDPDALLPDEVRPNEKLEARQSAVFVLSGIDIESARDALRVIARQADAESVRRTAINRISRQPERYREGDKAALRDALGDPAGSVREAAIRGAIYLDDADFAAEIAALIDSDTHIGVVIAAIQAVSVLDPATHRDAVTTALGSPRDEVRSQAATALARMEQSVTVTNKLLVLLGDDPSPTVRQAAANALGKTTTEESRDAVVRELRNAARGSSDSVGVASAYALGQIGGRSAETALLRLLADEDRPDAVRIAAAEALGTLGTADAIRELSRATRSRSADLRRAAVEALGNIGSEEATDVLLGSLSDDDLWVRNAARQALDKLDAPARDDLLDVLNDDKASASVRAQAVRSVASRNDPGDVEVLIEALGDDDSQVREAAVDELAQQTSAVAIRAIGDLLNSDPRSVFSQSPDSGGVSRSDYARIRIQQVRGAALVLGRMDHPLAREQLLKAVQDEANPARVQAIQALTQADCVLPGQLRSVGGRSYRMPTRTVRTAVSECQIRGGDIVQTTDAMLANVMLDASRDRDAEIRVAAVLALTTSATEPEVQARLETLAREDESAAVRSAAVGVLGRNRATGPG